MPILEKTLQELGLSYKEAKVYLACLELGSSPVQKIAQYANINRVTTYVILENLVKKGLASNIEKGKKTLFTAEEPVHLKSLLDKEVEEIEEKKKSLNQIMPELKELLQLSGKKPVVRVYEGRDGLVSLRKDYIKNSKTGSNWTSFIPIDYLYEVFPPPKEKLPSQRVKKRISSRVIYNTQKENVLPSDPKILRKTRCVPYKEFPFKSGIDIYGEDKTAIINYKDKLMGVMIESKELHDTFGIIFELAWEAAQKYQKDSCEIKSKKK